MKIHQLAKRRTPEMVVVVVVVVVRYGLVYRITLNILVVTANSCCECKRRSCDIDVDPIRVEMYDRICLF